MTWSSDEILQVLDKCAEAFSFPCLDNGYVYLAATRLSLFHSEKDWALVIEVFGFSPRSDIPDIHIYTFASKLHNRNERSNYVSKDAYKNYLKNNPYNESRFVFPIGNENWQDQNDPEFLNENGVCTLRNKNVELPSIDEYSRHGIDLSQGRPLVFEFCRYLVALLERNFVLATEEERRVSVLPDLEQILQLEEWHHPDIVGDELPSQNETFQQLAKVLETGDVSLYQPKLSPNTDWKYWPDGGTL